jgi:hypothetical protein
MGTNYDEEISLSEHETYFILKVPPLDNQGVPQKLKMRYFNKFNFLKFFGKI